MSTSTDTTHATEEELKELGLVSGHAYSLLRIYEVNDKNGQS